MGTYLYASPEQMAGEIYSSKADMYSLGMILFELCHDPFGTAMERIMTLQYIRNGIQPQDWKLRESHMPVANMILALLSPKPSKRPNAIEVLTWGRRFSSTLASSSSLLQDSNEFLRRMESSPDKVIHAFQVFAKDLGDASNSTIYHNLLLEVCDIIRAGSNNNVKIVQCGLNMQTDSQVLEFVLEMEKDEDSCMTQILDQICQSTHVATVHRLNQL